MFKITLQKYYLPYSKDHKTENCNVNNLYISTKTNSDKLSPCDEVPTTKYHAFTAIHKGSNSSYYHRVCKCIARNLQIFIYTPKSTNTIHKQGLENCRSVIFAETYLVSFTCYSVREIWVQFVFFCSISQKWLLPQQRAKALWYTSHKWWRLQQSPAEGRQSEISTVAFLAAY